MYSIYCCYNWIGIYQILYLSVNWNVTVTCFFEIKYWILINAKYCRLFLLILSRFKYIVNLSCKFSAGKKKIETKFRKKKWSWLIRSPLQQDIFLRSHAQSSDDNTFSGFLWFVAVEKRANEPRDLWNEN